MESVNLRTTQVEAQKLNHTYDAPLVPSCFMCCCALPALGNVTLLSLHAYLTFHELCSFYHVAPFLLMEANCSLHELAFFMPLCLIYFEFCAFTCYFLESKYRFYNFMIINLQYLRNLARVYLKVIQITFQWNLKSL